MRYRRILPVPGSQFYLMYSFMMIQYHISSSVSGERGLDAIHCSSRAGISIHALFVEFRKRVNSGGSRQCIEAIHILLRQCKIENGSVLHHSFLLDGFWHVYKAVLHTPSAKNLCRSLAVCGSNIFNHRIIECFAVPQGTIRLKDDAILLKLFNGILSVQKGISLNLIYQRKLCDSRIFELDVVFPG
jgi:hypothetical protein